MNSRFFIAAIIGAALLVSCGWKLPTSSAETSSVPLSFGEVGRVGDFGVEVVQTEDPYIPPPGTPASDAYEEGKTRLLAVEVTLYHRGGRENLKYSTLTWHLYDQDGHRFEAHYPDKRVKGPKMSEGYLTPGNMVSGWVTFEVPRDSVPHRVQFFEDFLSGKLVEFSFPEPN